MVRLHKKPICRKNLFFLYGKSILFFSKHCIADISFNAYGYVKCQFAEKILTQRKISVNNLMKNILFSNYCIENVSFNSLIDKFLGKEKYQFVWFQEKVSWYLY